MQLRPAKHRDDGANPHDVEAVIWESAFMNAAENDASACARITQVLATRNPSR